MREVMNARAVIVGEGTEEVKTKDLGCPTARKGRVEGAAKGGRSLSLGPMVVGTRKKATQRSRAVRDVRDRTSRRVGVVEEGGREWSQRWSKGDRRMGVEEEAMSKGTNPAKRINSEGRRRMHVGLKQITRDEAAEELQNTNFREQAS